MFCAIEFVHKASSSSRVVKDSRASVGRGGRRSIWRSDLLGVGREGEIVFAHGDALADGDHGERLSARVYFRRRMW